MSSEQKQGALIVSRMRKKKCDERRPVCKSCELKFLECTWPQLRNIQDNNNDKKSNTEGVGEQYLVPLYLSLAQESPKIRVKKAINTLKKYEEYEHLVEPQLFNVPALNYVIPDAEIDSVFLYQVFCNNFMPSLSPQVAAPQKLLPLSVFVPESTNYLLREVFYSCSAAYLARKIPEYRNISQLKYANLIRMLQKEIESNNLEGTEDWLFIAVQCLCLREKVLGNTATQSARHLSVAFRIIKKRQCSRKALATGQVEGSRAEEFEGFLRELSFGPEIETENSGTYGPDISALFGLDFDEITPTEKTLVESFIYNYTVSLYLCEDCELKKFPSPFEVFDHFRSLLNRPMYDCPVVWLNNSVVGPSLEAFELAGKASWLSRCSIHDNDYLKKMAYLLLQQALDYSPPALPAEVTYAMSQSKLKGTLYSLKIAQAIAKAALILLRKVLNPQLETFDLIIQKNVDIVYKCLKNLPGNHVANGICGWAIVVAGSCALSDEHKKLFRQRAKDLGNYLHAQYSDTMILFLDKAWGVIDNKSQGCDILLDRNALEQVNT
ncbi:uncharacterized protein PRCAT00004239001 [Priceomyces carsonii]|uniref:uncharacterized protein n=1 Tax=Priceomyces carsonii TaxID=28549 RepID=UPI002ED80993|nr:unnamed protein product [Priceomyces carsonii]